MIWQCTGNTWLDNWIRQAVHLQNELDSINVQLTQNQVRIKELERWESEIEKIFKNV